MNLSEIFDQMVEIHSGKVDLRDDRTKKKWTVTIEPFLLLKYPVTQEFYFEIMKENPGTFKGNQLPVETVTFLDAVFFCNKLSVQNGLIPCYTYQEGSEEIFFNKTADGFHLPTEAEWEYACKAGSTGIRYGELDSIAWYKDNSENRTHSVGQKMPNAWGLYDMLEMFGNGVQTYMTQKYMDHTVFFGVVVFVTSKGVLWQLHADAAIHFILVLRTLDSELRKTNKKRLRT